MAFVARGSEVWESKSAGVLCEPSRRMIMPCSRSPENRID